jgi:hypothetical protein
MRGRFISAKQMFKPDAAIYDSIRPMIDEELTTGSKDEEFILTITSTPEQINIGNVIVSMFALVF